MRRAIRGWRSRFVIALMVVLAGLGFWTYRQAVQLVPPEGVPRHSRPYLVERVIDGDTIVTRPLRGGPEIRVRYAGVDAPELHGDDGPQAFAPEAADINRQWVGDGPVWVATDERATDDHGRLLGYVFTRERFINRDLIAEGYAEVMLVAGTLQYADELVAAQREAREAGKGLWGTVEIVTEPARLPEYVGRYVQLYGQVYSYVPPGEGRPAVVRVQIHGEPAAPIVHVLIFPESGPYFSEFPSFDAGEWVEVVGRLQHRQGQLQVIAREAGQLQRRPAVITD